MLAGKSVRKVAIIGGNRIPFARSNTAYFGVSNQEMLTAALQGLVERFNLKGELIGEVAGGAVMKHSRDFNLVRECVIGSGLAPERGLLYPKWRVLKHRRARALLTDGGTRHGGKANSPGRACG